MAHFARERESPLRIVEAVVEVNERSSGAWSRRSRRCSTATSRGRVIGVLGLSFKPETDDMRDAPAIAILRGLIERGARVRAYDPQAMEHARKVLPEVVLCENAYEVCEGADALVVADRVEPVPHARPRRA